MKATDKIRVLETRQMAHHKATIQRLEDCLADVRENPEVNSVIICMEDRAGVLSIYWSNCEDRMRLGSKLMYAGMKRMGVKTG